MKSITTLRVLVPFFLPILLVACTVSNPRKYYAKASVNKPYDVVIVPGTPLMNGAWDRTTKGRLMWAQHLFESGMTKNIITSGSAVYTPFVEGLFMREYAIGMGLPEDRVFAETKAEHSTENLYYGYKLARSLGFEKIALATDVFQSKMLKKFNRKMHRRIGAEMAIIPMILDTLEAMTPPDVVIDTTIAYRTDFVALPDRESFWKRFKGTLGNNIDWDSD